jgi:hypothetical protein
MSEHHRNTRLAEKVGAGVLILEAIPAFFLDPTWQGWLLLFGVAVLAFVVTAVLTRGQRI